MSKRLYIVRHAKSSWDYEDISDIDRPLSIRGITDAGVMAGRLKSKGDIPSLMISSPACRAIHTAVIFARVLKFPWEQLMISEKIYPGTINDILKILENIEERHSSIMIFGHNPALTELADYFLKYPVNNIPTAGIVTLNFSGEGWKDLKESKAKSELIDFPRKV
jgi:phosphohistidine phosphatase